MCLSVILHKHTFSIHSRLSKNRAEVDQKPDIVNAGRVPANLNSGL